MPYGATTPQTELADFGTLSAFQRETPEPKVVKVDIPAGLDLDITDAVGPVGWHDGTDTFDIYITTETEAERLQAMRELTALVHGQRLRYRLSWDSAYYCQGRFTVQYERMNPHVSRASVTVDREAWKQGVSRESHVIDCHPEGSYALEGSMRYRSVRVTLAQGAYVAIGPEEPGILTDHRSAGTYTLANDAYSGESVWVDLDSWLMYVDGNNYVVNSEKFSVSGSNAVIDASYTVTDGNMVFPDEAKQKVTVDFYRWDV